MTNAILAVIVVALSICGMAIGLIVKNKDWENWKDKMAIEKREKMPKKVTLPRPGHADLAGVEKYDFDDIRNVLERSSARETTMRVAIASVCRKLLKDIGISVASSCLLYTSPSPRDRQKSRMPSSA